VSRPETPEGGFLSRWSRLKQETKREDATPAPQPEAAVPPAADIDAGREQPPLDEELPLPSLDDITPGADVTAFFGKHVPEALRTAALRKLWITDPDIKDFIEMADYQWDFTNPDSIPGWSSKLEGVDVKALVDRIFGEIPAAVDREKAAADSPDTLSEPVEPLAPEDENTLGENTETADIPDSSSANRLMRPAVAADDVAMQKNPSDSGVYALQKRRHGGALPT
jgi:Protein of unknown function (DUF3306)